MEKYVYKVGENEVVVSENEVKDGQLATARELNDAIEEIENNIANHFGEESGKPLTFDDVLQIDLYNDHLIVKEGILIWDDETKEILLTKKEKRKMEKYYDMSKYPIYNAEMPESNYSSGDVNEYQSGLMELLKTSIDDSKSLLDSNKELRGYFDQLKEICESQSERIKRNQKSSIIMSEFIFNKVDDVEWVNYLKDLKSNPEYKDYKEEIETLLTEYGADEDTEKFLQEQYGEE